MLHNFFPRPSIWQRKRFDTFILSFRETKSVQSQIKPTNKITEM